MTARRVPAWASDFARGALDDDLLLRACAALTAYPLAADAERAAVLDRLAFLCSFHDLTTKRARPVDRRKALRRLADRLRRAAHELALAGEYAQFVAGTGGVSAAALRTAAERVENAAAHTPFSTAGAQRAAIIADLGATLKAATGRYHDALTADLANLALRVDDISASAVKLARRRYQVSPKSHRV